MMLSELVSTAEAVAATSSRLAKIDALSQLLAQADADELPALTGLLLAAPRQGRLGVGWRGLSALDVTHAADATLTITDVDDALDTLAHTSGSGSTAARSAALTALAARATAPEWDFLSRSMRGASKIMRAGQTLRARQTIRAEQAMDAA